MHARAGCRQPLLAQLKSEPFSQRSQLCDDVSDLPPYIGTKLDYRGVCLR